MDKNQIYTLVINAVVTIVTTTIVLKLSASQGNLGIKNRLEKIDKRRFKTYIVNFWFLLVFLFSSFEVYKFIVSKDPVGRPEIVLICFNMIFAFASMSAVVFNLGFLSSYKGNTKE